MKPRTLLLVSIQPATNYSLFNHTPATDRTRRTVAESLDLLQHTQGDDLLQVVAHTSRTLAKACRKNDTSSLLLEENTPQLELLTGTLAMLGVDVYTPTYAKAKGKIKGLMELVDIDLPTLPGSRKFLRKLENAVAYE